MLFPPLIHGLKPELQLQPQPDNKMDTLILDIPRRARSSGLKPELQPASPSLRGPVILVEHMDGGDTVRAMVQGALRRYVLAKALPNPPDLVCIRVDRAAPDLAEVYRLGITEHLYLGTAINRHAGVSPS